MKKALIYIFLFHTYHLTSMEHYQQWNPSEYGKNATRKNNDAKQLFSSLTLTDEISIVDIGCGPGIITAFMAERTHGEVVGIDHSPEMINYAKHHYKDFKNLTFIQQNAETFSTSNNNVITAFSSLHWMKNQQKVFCLIGSSLKNNGFFIATIAYKNFGQNTLLEVIQKAILSDRWMAYLNNENILNEYLFSHNETTIRPLLIKARLKSKKINKKNTLLQFKTIHAYKNWLNSWIWGFSFLSSIPGNEKDNFLEDIIDRYSFEQVHSGKDPLEYESSTLQVIAQKKRIMH